MTSYAHLFQNLIVKLDGLACHGHNLQTKLIHIYLQNDPGTHKLDPPSLHMVSRHWQTGCFLEIPNQTINIQLQQILHIHLLCTPMHWIQTQQNIMQWHLLQKLSRSRHSNLTCVFNFPVGHYQLKLILFLPQDLPRHQTQPCHVIRWRQMIIREHLYFL